MKIFIVTGPSGVGKSHLIYELEKLGLYSLEIYTDRKARPSETEVTDRVYMSQDEFSAQLKDFLYWFSFQGNRYGYKKADIERQRKARKHLCLTIPPSFIPDLLEHVPEAIVLYLYADESAFPLLRERMIKRDISSHDTPSQKKDKIEKIDKRLAFAQEELRRIETIQKSISHNALSKMFSITHDAVLYDEVIPYVRSLTHPS